MQNLKSSMERVNSVQRRIQVEVAAESVSQAFESMFRRVQKDARVQGFRPGKAPMNIIKKLYGGRVSYDVSEDLIRQSLGKALMEHSVNPVASPVVEEAPIPTPGQTFSFKVLVDVLPELTISDYKGLAVKVEKSSVADADVEREIDQIRRSHAKAIAASPEATVAAGDLVRLTIHATEGGQPFAPLEVHSMPAIVAAGGIPAEIEKIIMGMKAGDERKSMVEFAADHSMTPLAGKKLEVTVNLEDLKNMELPAMDDAFAKTLGTESADDLQKKMRESLESRAERNRRQQIEAGCLDQILDKHAFEVPPSLVDRIVDDMIDEVGFDKEAEKAKARQDEELRKRFEPVAKRRARNTLLLWHVAKTEKVEVSEAEMEDYIEKNVLRGRKNDKSADQIRKNAAPQVRENLMLQKAMDVLVNSAKLEEVAAGSLSKNK
jgi:trigger factor